MSNGARHTWGFFAGVALTAALGALLIFGSYRLQHGYMTQFHKQDKWIGGGLLAGAAVVFAILAASRISPMASLIGGLALTAAGVLFFVSQKTTADLINHFPFKPQRVTLAGLEEEGFILFAGVGLLFASFFPSRWRRRTPAGDSDGYEYGLPDSREDAYGAQTTYADRGGYRDAYGTETAADSGRNPREDQPTTQSPYAAGPQGGYDDYENYETQHQQPGYDAPPLYEPPQQQGYGSGRSPFNPTDESGGTREMRRPE